jgi:apolipoprotein D and lipocalin family protein
MKSRNYRITGILFVIIGLFLGASFSRADELQTVTSVDLSRYVGKWYEIARYPNSFESDCYNSTAEYTTQSDGTIAVVNTCVKTNGDSDRAEGLAEVVDTQSHAKLKVSFLPAWLRWTGLGEGDYWVIQLGAHYEYSVVSEPSREYLWILSRESSLDSATYTSILKSLVEQGFDTSKLEQSRKP